MSSKKPNILFIMADQLTPYALGVYGNSEVKTPNIDQLARRGMIFNNAYCNSPLCTPARMCLFTGRQAHNTRCYDNGMALSSNVPTMMHYLAREDYRTIASGKLHIIGRDQFHGFEERLTPDRYPGGPEWTYDWDKDIRKRDNSSYFDGLVPWSKEYEYDDLVQVMAKRRLRKLCLKEETFFMLVSYTNPHPPFSAMEPYWSLYENQDISIPEWPENEIRNEHPLYRWVREYHRTINKPGEEDVYKAKRAYYANISYIDEKVGELINLLEKTGQIDNTIVIFTSDHGEMLGQHGHWCKRVPYEWSQKVPLFFSWKNRIPENKETEKIVSHVDLLPTIMELLGADEPINIDGDSMAPILEGEDKDWKNEALSGNYTEGVKSASCMLRKDKYKYISVVGEAPILYDLEKDPEEKNNVSGDEIYQKIEQNLKARLDELWDGKKIDRDVRLSKKERFVIIDALERSSIQPWDYYPLINDYGKDQKRHS